MNIKSWYEKRGMSFILERAHRLQERYGITAKKAEERIVHCVEALKSFGCLPTFAVPGMVIKRNLPFIRRLQNMGVEIAVHGYNHIDLKACTPEYGSQQLVRAAEVFHASQLAVHGFRCPYLSATDELLKAIPDGIFKYSSNKAIQWPFGESVDTTEKLLFETIEGFYVPSKAEKNLCIPWTQDGIIEIPVCVPDDLQLHDGLGYGLEEISRVWSSILRQTYRRGELFNLMFHPELADFCESPFLSVIKEARSFEQEVWIARLQDISDWWKEKTGFRVETTFAEDNTATIQFFCTLRATILYRGFDPKVRSTDWDGNYRRLEAQFLQLEDHHLPFIGVPSGAPQWVVSSLRGMGYIVDTSETAQQCSIYLDDDCLKGRENPVDLIAYLEQSPMPLVRFWPWPDGKRSAVSITGDLDALSILDYVSRLFAN